jgi:hypothetical protein
MKTALSLLVAFSAACAQGIGTPDDLNAPDDATGASRVHLFPMHPPEIEALRETRNAASKPHLTYYGGPVLGNVKVQIVYWSDASKVFGQGQLEQYYSDITNSAYFDWLNEYNTPTQQVGRGSFIGSATATGAKIGSVTDANLQTQLTSMLKSGALNQSDPANTIYMIHFPPGMSISQGGSSSCSQFCAYHGTFTYSGHDVFYGVIPDQGADGCESGCGSGDHLQNTTSTASHELIEAVTDAAVGLATTNGPPLAWYDNANGEIGDICVTGSSYTSVVGNWTVQNEWSNKAGKCIATNGSSPPPQSDFGLSVGDATVQAGSSTTVRVTTTAVGTAESVKLAVSGLPSGVTGSLDKTSVSSGATATLTLTASSSAAAVTTQFTVTGTAASGSHAATGNVTVTTNTPPPAQDDFSVAVAARSSTVAAGSSTTIAVTTAVVSGSPGRLALSLGSLPAGISGSFDSSTIDVGGSATLTVTVDSSAKAGRVSVAVTATDSGSSNAHTASTSLTITAGTPPPPPPPHGGNLISNGDFETQATGWSRGGNALITTRAFHDGSHSALVGTSGSTFSGDSYIYQGVDVPASGSTTLSFWHLMRCRDPNGGGEIAAFIVDSQGYVLDSVYDTCDTDKDWTQETYDLSPLGGQSVYVYFYTYSSGFYSAASWQYIDSVEVTNE